MQTEVDRSKRGIVLLGVALWLFSPALMAQGVRPARYPMSSAVVARALEMNGLDVKPSDVHLPMILSASTPSPNLEITATERLAAGRVRLQLRCRKAGDCVPFNATLDVRSAAAVAAEAGVKSASHGAVTIGNPGNMGSIPGGESLGSSPATIANRTSSLRAGSKVVLVLKDDYMTIHMPAIALDSGAPGTGVRVCTADRKKTFHATVVDQMTVTGVMD